MTKGTSENDFVWSFHARQQMELRGVTREQVLEAINHPDGGLAEVAQTTGSLCYRHTYPSGRTLKVWVVPGTRGPRTIKSAAWEGEDD